MLDVDNNAHLLPGSTFIQVSFFFAFGSVCKLLEASTSPPNIVCGRISDLSARTFARDTADCSFVFWLPDGRCWGSFDAAKVSLDGEDEPEGELGLELILRGEAILIGTIHSLRQRATQDGTGRRWQAGRSHFGLFPAGQAE